MTRLKGAKDLVSRRYRHAFAWQHLNALGVTLFQGSRPLNQPVGTLYPIKLFRSHYYAGDQFLPPGEIRKLTSYQALMDLGFVVISTDVRGGRGQPWESTQRVLYEIRRADETGEHYGKMPRDHFVEYDTTNQRVRLIGARAGPLNYGPWVEQRRTIPEAMQEGRPVSLYSYTEKADVLLERLAQQWSGTEAGPRRVSIPEIPFMITDANEIVCFPITGDMPSILITGVKRIGKCVLQESQHDFVLDGEGRPCKMADHPKTALVLDDQYRLVSAPVTGITSRQVTGAIVVDTERSRSVTLTPEHPVLTPDGWKPIGDLRMGDFIAVPDHYPASGAAHDPPRRDVEALAYWLAAGTWKTRRRDESKPTSGKRRVYENPAAYIVLPPLTLDRPTASQLFASVGLVNTVSKYPELRALYCDRAAVTALLEQYGINPAAPHVPGAIMRASPTTVRCFLSAWFTVRGIVDQSHNYIRWACGSETLARQLHHLCLRAGLTANLSTLNRPTRPRPLYRVGLNEATAVKQFTKWVHCPSPRLRHQLASLKFRPVSAIPDPRVVRGDDIPRAVLLQYASDPERLRRVMRGMSADSRTVRRTNVQRLAKTLPDSGLQRVLDAPIGWVRITALTRKTGTFTAWDMAIDHPGHNFIANDVLVHNSFCLHSLVDRFFWKPGLGYKLCILNDSSRETGTWCLPNRDAAQIQMLARLGERPLPLPCMYFHPSTKMDYDKLHMKTVGFDVVIPFREIVESHKLYLTLKESTRYFTKIIPDLLQCRSAEAAEAVFENMEEIGEVPAPTINKIRAEFETLLDSRMTDISTKGQELWHTSTYPDAQYNPFSAALVGGALPVLVTEFLTTHPDKRLLPMYFSLFAGDLFMRQRQDSGFRAEQSEIVMVVDEAHNISQPGLPIGGDLMLRRCVREGGPNRIGTILATQKFSELPAVIRDNSTHLIIFKNPGEAAMIAKQYNLGKHIADQITDLAKHQCIAYTTDHYVVYDSHGKRRRSRLNEVFVGRTLPPYSQHKRPKTGDGGT